MSQTTTPVRYWNTEEHSSFNSDTQVDHLLSRLDVYRSTNASFPSRNANAFQFANRDSEVWWDRFALVAAEPDLWTIYHEGLKHLASASYTRLNGPLFLMNSLNSPEPQVVKGMLTLLPHLRTLKMDGSDKCWPMAMLDPQVIPHGIAQAMKNHPQLASLAARALSSYGSDAESEVNRLVPLLLSEDGDIAASAKSAILAIDPEGLAKKLHLQETSLTDLQKKLIQTELKTRPVPMDRLCDREHSTALLNLFRRRTDHTTVPALDPEGDQRFLRDADPEVWWPILLAAAYDWRFREFHNAYLTEQIAAALYQKTDSLEIVARILQSENPTIACQMMVFVSKIRICRDPDLHYLDGDLIDTRGMPGRFADVLKRHPTQCIYVARSLATYRLHASQQAPILVPHLLSDDPATVWEIRYALTTIAPQLASELECELGSEDYNDFVLEFSEPATLDLRQRELVQKYLKTIR